MTPYRTAPLRVSAPRASWWRRNVVAWLHGVPRRLEQRAQRRALIILARALDADLSSVRRDAAADERALETIKAVVGAIGKRQRRSTLSGGPA